jgi:hypothetical protein
VNTSREQQAQLASAIASLDSTVHRLSKLSQRSYQNPYLELEKWPEEVLPEQDWFSSPEYLSLYGTPWWDRFDEPTRRRLAFYEAVNFFSLNIHGEKGLMGGLAERLYRKDLLEVSEYLHHFLDEENKHSIYFGGFCSRFAKVYRSRQFTLEDSRDPQNIKDFLFFVKTMIFEEIVDRYNWVQSKDARLHPVARFINHNHHFEEARHLIFGRRLVTALWQSCAPHWDGATVEGLRGYLGQYFVATWREYYNPDVYADLGLEAPWEVAEQAWAAPAQRKHRRAVSQKVLKFLVSVGILTGEPADAF